METLAGRYELLEVLGRGGMGVVYRARDRTLDRIVAVKVLPTEHAGNPALVERFEREARAAARLNHPNIVAVFDTGRDAGARYFVMECVKGQSVAQLLADRRRIPPAEAAGYAAQVADALAAAHEAGIIHRDIKPANVMVASSGTAKVLDFGIARAAVENPLTQSTMVLGSAPYMAPEVALGQQADERSDIYALGCVTYEMVSGEPPFRGELPAAVMNQHATASPQPLREVQPDVPAGLDALVSQMLAKDPDERPQPAGELAARLRSAPTETAATRIVPPATAATAVAARAPEPPPARPRAPAAPPPAGPPAEDRRGRNGLLAIGAVLVAALVAAAVAVAIVSSSGSGGHRRSSTTRSSPSSSASSSATTTVSTSTTGHSTTVTTTTTTTPSRSTTSPSTSTSSSSTTAPTTTHTTSSGGSGGR